MNFGNPTMEIFHSAGTVLHLTELLTISLVLAENFEFAPAGSPGLWLPLKCDGRHGTRRGLRCSRRGPYATRHFVTQAFAEMQTINASLAAANPTENDLFESRCAACESRLQANSALLLVLFGAVGFVLMIAVCQCRDI